MMTNDLDALANYGRFGDTELAHLTPGELVVPRAFQTPELIEAFKKTTNEAGIDPARFLVNSGIASVNPQTHLQEFFLDGLLENVIGSVISTGIDFLFGGGSTSTGGSSNSTGEENYGGAIGSSVGGSTGEYGTPTKSALGSGMGELLPRLIKGGLGALIGKLLAGKDNKGEQTAGQLASTNENTYPNIKPFNITRAPMQGITAIPSATGGEAQYF